MGFDTRAISIACSEADNPKLEFHLLKSSLTSYGPSTLFLTFWSIWGSWKLSQMIPHHPEHVFWHQNHVFSMFRSWITPQVKLSLLEVILDPLQPLHPILDCQVDLRLLKMVPNDSPSPKTWGLTPEPWPWHIQKLSYSPSYSFTSWSPPWPPTAPPPHS